MRDYSTIRTESAHSIAGVSGRLWRIKSCGVRAAGCWDAQKWISESRPVKGFGPGAALRVEIRFDDQYQNGHNSFAVTGSITSPRGRNIACGCLHEDIAQVFPEIAHLIKWHLCSTEGPMHYVANTCYLAGNRDCNGKAPGEVARYETRIKFGNFPITFKPTSDSFVKWLQESIAADAEWILDKVEHAKRPGDRYEFGPKFSLAGYTDKWHECPFDSEHEANEFINALCAYPVQFVRIPTSYSKGKPRELDAARSIAVWPDATDEILCAPRDVLEKALIDRLPALLAPMRADIEAAGFTWQAPEV